MLAPGLVGSLFYDTVLTQTARSIPGMFFIRNYCATYLLVLTASHLKTIILTETGNSISKVNYNAAGYLLKKKTIFTIFKSESWLKRIEVTLNLTPQLFDPTENLKA